MLDGPPRVPKSFIWLFCQRKAREPANPTVEVWPVTCPALLIPVALLVLPSSVPRSVTTYAGGLSALVRTPAARQSVSAPTAHRAVDTARFMEYHRFSPLVMSVIP